MAWKFYKNSLVLLFSILFSRADDYDSDNKALMTMQDDVDFYIHTIKSDNQIDSVMDIIPLPEYR